jgi:hypothetical protein
MPSRRTALVFLGTGAVTTLQRGSAAANDAKSLRPGIEHYATPRGGELVKEFTLTDGKFYLYTSLYTLRIPDLAIGDVLQAHCQIQVANNVFRASTPPRPDNVQLSHAMLMHPTEMRLLDAEKFPPNSEIVMPCPPAGENITPAAHYGFRTLIGSAQVTRKTKLGKGGSLWLSVVVCAASDAMGFAGQKLDVLQEYGGLSAVVFRKPA